MVYSVAPAWSRFVICFRPNLCAAICLVALALSLQGCGRRGPLEPPPGATPINAPLSGTPDQNDAPRSAAEVPGFVPQTSGGSVGANTPATQAPNVPAPAAPPASAAPQQSKAPPRPSPLDPLL
ncbi:MAG: lipoprotein [Methylocella sp.]